MFGTVILNLALTGSSIVNLRHPVLDYLGRIFYGLYMWHFMAITIGSWLVSFFFNGDSPAQHFFGFLATVTVSIALAALSYHYLENPFLRLKKRFARIESGS